MGIQGLMKLISDAAPTSVRETDIKSYFGRKIAIDASMSLYQFLIAMRSDGAQLANSEGETTSHLVGIFYRTIRLVENGIKPIYVFDGHPPNLKSKELDKRAERREEAQKALTEAEEAGDAKEIDKFSRRLVKVTREHVEQCKELLKLMGIPYIDAPCEAEAQCAAMVKSGKVYAAATEDMDALTFGSSILVRHMTFSEARKLPIQEIHLDKLLCELELNQSEFIDLCILLGCDYCQSITGIGPKRAIEFIMKYKNIEAVLENMDGKFTPPENWLYKEARELFVNPEVIDPESLELKWSEPDVEGLVKYLCGDKMFNEERVRNGAKKLTKARTGQVQERLDKFFTILPKTTNPKRKVEEKPKPAKKARGGSSKRGK